MPESLFSIHVYLRRSPRARWRFRDGVAAANAIAQERQGKLRGETLTVSVWW